MEDESTRSRGFYCDPVVHELGMCNMSMALIDRVFQTTDTLTN